MRSDQDVKKRFRSSDGAALENIIGKMKRMACGILISYACIFLEKG